MKMSLPARISKEDQSSLNDLQFHWDSAYTIRFDGELWTAVPLTDATTVLTAESADHLRGQIRDDYHANDRRHMRLPSDGCSL